MRPDGDTTNAFVYCLAWAAHRCEVRVVFFLAMSNHYHAGVIDSSGRLPEFLEHFHKLFSKHQNALRGRWENFWSSEQTSVVELVGPDDVMDKMVYALTNPVKDHLVVKAADWPGASSLHATRTSDKVTAFRPRHFFRPDGPMPDTISLELVSPPGFEHLESGAFAELLTDRIRSVEDEAACQRRDNGRPVLGREAIVRQPWSDCPDTMEPRRLLSPRVACRNLWRRIETLRRNRAFIAAYRCAREQFLAGLPTVFPAGTYWLRRFVGITCEPPPGPA
jgi:putative transposase